ncbi:LacI family transcriptional regulator [Erysipelothrix sp. HDW6C]|uniref:LacI family DNA-binding transcriptional regulator n=1 Tax=Erysipelothrix sp. HDW6C TaxID=2714930 RepID=UPI00140E8544|nr:LacI family DNA-binding transcriptional regulator [Erysipelothrix sp. HDW6C]QIK69411.1 LacI family transcriptional regulator [Erysipelothrix sp. HDW6C]
MSTLRDVAKLANVSAATVSRVLSEDHTFKISDETRQTIMDAVATLNYTYKSKKKGSIPFRVAVILALTSEKYGDPFFNTILSTIEEECSKHNINLIAIKNYTELNAPNGFQELLDLQPDGVFLMENLPKSILDALVREINHIVGIDFDSYHFNNVGFDKLEATNQAMDYLFRKGFRDIAYIGGSTPNEEFEGTHRMIGYRESLRRHQIPMNPRIVFDCGWDIDTCAHMTESLMASEHRPEAIFAGSDTLAAVILSVLYEKGYKVPEDISVLGFNDIPGSAHTIPTLTTINVPTKTIGQLAVKRMRELVIEGDTLITNTLVTTHVVERNSIRKDK